MQNLNNYLKNYKGKKVLMTIFPHPDDETMATGGLLLVAKKLGWKTIVVTLTKGDRGQCYINRNGKTLSEIRTTELKNAVKILNVDKLVLGDFKDATLKNNQRNAEKWVKNIIKTESPLLVFTYDHSGFTGHPDHIALSLAVLKVIKQFKGIDLYWTSVAPGFSKFIINKKVLKYLPEAQFKLDFGFGWYKKLMAANEHKSQKLTDGKLFLFLLYLSLIHTEWYYKVNLDKSYKYKFVDFKI